MNPYTSIFSDLTFPPPPKPTPRLDLKQSIKIQDPEAFPVKLFRLRKGVMTYINGYGKDMPSSVLHTQAEADARSDDRAGDTYLVLNLETGKAVQAFKLQVPVTPKKAVTL